MKKIIGFAVLCLLSVIVNASTISSGSVFYPEGSYLQGQQIRLGIDPYGYNYQEHRFEGSYWNAYANEAGYPPLVGSEKKYLETNPGAALHFAWDLRNVHAVRTWNDAYLSNQDNDNDGFLDTHLNFLTYIGSGAWTEITISGTSRAGKRLVRWSEFYRLEAAPLDAVLRNTVWYDTAGNELGANLDDVFMITRYEVENLPPWTK